MLGEWAPVDVEAPGMDFAERLGLWLNAFDAIGLEAALRSIQAIETAPPRAPSDGQRTGTGTLHEDFGRVRSALAHAIARELAPTVGEMPADADYSRYQQRHAALQRQMEQMIGPLRAQVRQAIGGAGTKLRQLAALDAALEPVLAPREQALLPTATALMARRFEQLRGTAEPGWEPAFSAQWREALLAELDLRLAPVAGLIEALGNQQKNRP